MSFKRSNKPFHHFVLPHIPDGIQFPRAQRHAAPRHLLLPRTSCPHRWLTFLPPPVLIGRLTVCGSPLNHTRCNASAPHDKAAVVTSNARRCFYTCLNYMGNFSQLPSFKSSPGIISSLSGGFSATARHLWATSGRWDFPHKWGFFLYPRRAGWRFLAITLGIRIPLNRLVTY